jgi:hypothetical protein
VTGLITFPQLVTGEVLINRFRRVRMMLARPFKGNDILDSARPVCVTGLSALQMLIELRCTPPGKKSEQRAAKRADRVIAPGEGFAEPGEREPKTNPAPQGRQKQESLFPQARLRHRLGLLLCPPAPQAGWMGQLTGSQVDRFSASHRILAYHLITRLDKGSWMSQVCHCPFKAGRGNEKFASRGDA